MMLPLKNL